ncbi:hypothetical protein EG329_003759 [Mollisiaceae sp. DMI_Dod_QoI]|nr:hypothetical protein EG329_003759 [Helotiales sp. DMI_Dod_QoI]
MFRRLRKVLNRTNPQEKRLDHVGSDFNPSSPRLSHSGSVPSSKGRQDIQAAALETLSWSRNYYNVTSIIQFISFPDPSKARDALASRGLESLHQFLKKAYYNPSTCDKSADDLPIQPSQAAQDLIDCIQGIDSPYQQSLLPVCDLQFKDAGNFANMIKTAILESFSKVPFGALARHAMGTEDNTLDPSVSQFLLALRELHEDLERHTIESDKSFWGMVKKELEAQFPPARYITPYNNITFKPEEALTGLLEVVAPVEHLIFTDLQGILAQIATLAERFTLTIAEKSLKWPESYGTDLSFLDSVTNRQPMESAKLLTAPLYKLYEPISLHGLRTTDSAIEALGTHWHELCRHTTAYLRANPESLLYMLRLARFLLIGNSNHHSATAVALGIVNAKRQLDMSGEHAPLALINPANRFSIYKAHRHTKPCFPSLILYSSAAARDRLSPATVVSLFLFIHMYGNPILTQPAGKSLEEDRRGQRIRHSQSEGFLFGKK